MHCAQAAKIREVVKILLRCIVQAAELCQLYLDGLNNVDAADVSAAEFGDTAECNIQEGVAPEVIMLVNGVRSCIDIH
jgi:hypothetical protein